MCGIAGIITQDPVIAQTALLAMVAAQTHRGPDDRGDRFISCGVKTLGIGFRRLAIIDLTPAGHQPMVHPETGDCLVFNGEIYNFQNLRQELADQGVKFRGQSDTEVLLQALVRWGPAALERLAGMYAFAFYQCREQKLLLARDPLGIKPLYVAKATGTFLFSSEVRGLLASGLVPRRINARAVAGFCSYGFVPEPETIIESITEFPAGCYQLLDAEATDGNATEPHRYWNIPIPRTLPAKEDVCQELRSRLQLAVREHLISDVPSGVFLSAGLDSTLVASLAARETNQLRTFTVGFADNPGLSESKLAADTARRLGAQHTDIQLLAKDAEQACLPWLEALDQPSVDGLNTFIISRAIRSQGMVVALSGLGGDELFGGYSTFRLVPRLANMLRTVGWLPTWSRRLLSDVATMGRSTGVTQKARDMAQRGPNLFELCLQVRRLMSDRQLARLGVDPLRLGLTQSFLPPETVDCLRGNSGLQPESDDLVWNISRWESRFYMANMLLRDADANGMSQSLEIRVPFLDRRVLDYVYALPGSSRLPKSAPGKYLLRRCFADLLPEELTNRSKTGFTLPIGRWLQGPLRELGEDAIHHLKGSGLLRPKGIDEIWNGFQASRETTHWSRPFALCVLGHFLRRWQAA
jgi:asparagine synthase (glutamine-hydrolysing)